jgi:aquaporin TIP
MTHARALIAEAIGTFALCFAGILALTSLDLVHDTGPAHPVVAALGHGLILIVMIAALAHHSGAHFNPAVTFGFMITRRMEPVKGLLYIAAQIGGALLASALVAGMYGVDAVIGGTPGPAPDVNILAVLASEAVATFFLVLVIFGTAVDERAPRSVFPFAIGLTVAACILAIGPITGAALNPARVLGPALVGLAFDAHWVYWVGPLLGGAAAALLQHHVLLVRAPDAVVGEHGGPAQSEQRIG